MSSNVSAGCDRVEGKIMATSEVHHAHPESLELHIDLC
jgi:hypothetical protein